MNTGLTRITDEDQALTRRWRTELTDAGEELIADHRVDGRPSVPGTLQLELAAQVASRLDPELMVGAFTDIRFERFLRHQVRGGMPGIWIEAVPGEEAATSDITIGTSSTSAALPNRVTTGMRIHLRRTSGACLEPVPLPVDEGDAAVDPYQQPGAPALLSGVFAALTEPRRHRDAGSALFRIAQTDPPDALGACRLPFVALDCMLRTGMLTPLTADPVLQLAVPTRVRRVDLFTTANDLKIGDLRLVHRPANGRAPGTVTATTADGRCLLRAEFTDVHVLAYYDLRTGTWLPVGRHQGRTDDHH